MEDHIGFDFFVFRIRRAAIVARGSSSNVLLKLRIILGEVAKLTKELVTLLLS